MGLIGLVWLVSGLFLVALIVRVLRLATGPQARALARRHPIRTVLWFGLVVPLSAPAVLITIMVWQTRADSAARDAAVHHVLDAPTRLGGLDLPAGTALELARPHDRASFRYARFPAVHTVHGVKTRLVFRDLDASDPSGRPPTSMTIAAEEDTWIDGWRCRASPGELLQAVRVAPSADGTTVRLTGCHAADGNRVDGAPIPADSEIAAIDGAQGPGRWRIAAPRHAVVPVLGVPVYRARFQVDDAHRAVMLESAALACRLSLGPVVYAPGTDVEPRDAAWHDVPADAWVFMTDAGHPAMRDGTAVEPGAWVVQARDGRVFRVIPAAAAPGPFARFDMGGEPAAGPASPETACDAMMSSWPAETTPPPVTTTR